MVRLLCICIGKQIVEHLLPLSEPLNALTPSRWAKDGNTDSALGLGKTPPVRSGDEVEKSVLHQELLNGPGPARYVMF